jgi:nucleotide-binding universal stress UspA family protein
MFDRILVPLDGTPIAEQVLGLAGSLARAGNSRLHLARVVRPPRGELVDQGRSLTDDEQEGDYLESVATRVRAAGVPEVSTAQLVGDNVGEALEAHRREVGAGLTVLCTHGHGPLKRAWLGSVADALVRTSEAPVLLVRAGAASQDNSGDVRTAWPFRRVVIALDGTHFSRQSFGPATQLAGGPDTVFVLARILERSGGKGSRFAPSADPDEPLARAKAVAEAKLGFEVQSFSSYGFGVESVVEFAPSVAEGILELARRRAADLIVVATHGRSGIPRMVLGSVADKVIRAADLPVLVVRPREA